MKIVYATMGNLDELVVFFEKNINKIDFSDYYYEYFCPYGLKAAIKKEQVILLKRDDYIVGAVRFYPRKKENIVSVYQFALDKSLRGNGLLIRILKFTGYSVFLFTAEKSLTLNDYFKKQNWELFKFDNNFNYWKLKI